MVASAIFFIAAAFWNEQNPTITYMLFVAGGINFGWALGRMIFTGRE